MSGDVHLSEEEVAASEHDRGETAEAEPIAESLEPVAPEQRLAEAEAKRDEYLADLQRLAADFDNYRKRVLQQQDALGKASVARVLGRLLPVVDDLGRALDAAEQHDEAQVLEGVRLTRDALLSVLESEGLVEIEAVGRFDPHVHEALMTQPSESGGAGEIIQVVQKGYRLGDTVLRPTRVIVAE